MYQQILRALAAAVPGGAYALVPKRIAGLIDYSKGYWNTFYPWGGPMNGQTARLEIARAIIEKYQIEQIIETGTYRGTTTEWFAQFNVPVLSVETHEQFAAFSRRRLRHLPNVRIECCDSTTAVKAWAADSGITSKRTLFYLDAHWKDHLPLREELELIDQYFKSWIAIVDDFKVANDPDYGFDDYGDGKVLDLDYIRKCKLSDFVAFFPEVAGKWETGLKRGCVVLVANRDGAATCRAMPLLRPATGD